MNIVFIRALILYIIVIFSVRLMGKRQIGELQPSELVITILVSNIATLPLEDLNIPLVMGILPILSLVCFEVIMSWLSLKSKRLRHAVSGSPKVIIRDGVLDQKVMEDLRFSVDDLMTALRGNSVFDIADVQFAIVETNGSVSVYEKYAQRNVKNTDLNLTGTSMDPPVIIVSDGKLITQGLNETGLKKQWVYDLIERKHMELSDIFLLTADKNGTYNLIKRSSGK
ncbi:MAG: DUF421 domain-containing protein [Oscillospiraceae bacterium]|nr:DUF421 domain-containing protein [Oscillospiraceae bacterium]